MMEEIFLETTLGTIYGKAVGERQNPPVLGIHGWSQRNGWHTWEPMMAPLAEAGFWVISIDMPGWGRSVPPQTGPLVGERFVQVIATVLDELEIETAVLMGKSWGGGLALSLALSQPQRVEKLILTAPAFRQLEELNHISQPILLAWAEDDPVIPYKYADAYTVLPTVQLESYATGGHSAAQNNVDDFAPKAIQFLRQA